jgi:hypothetical protein
MLFNPYEVKRKLDGAAPILALILLSMAVDEALEQESLKPLTDLAADIFGSGNP